MIVGSGIVGCFLGTKLGNTEIWEKDSKLIEKPCSGLLSKSGIKSINLNIDNCVLNEVKGAIIHSPNFKFKVEKPHNVAYVLDRLQLQKNLAQDAKNSGCKIKYKNKWDGQQDKYIIGSDGALSQVARSEKTERKYIHTYQIETKYKTDQDYVHLFFNKNSKDFFSWVIPVNEKTARIGLGTSEWNAKAYFEDQFPNLKSKKQQGGLIPIFDNKKTIFGNKVLVGDAAAQVKATTGGGIIFGCKCAEVLKKAIDKEDLNYYEKNWRKKCEFDLKMHLKIRKFLSKVDYDLLFLDLLKNNIPKLISKHGDMDHPREMMTKILSKKGLWKHFPNFLFP